MFTTLSLSFACHNYHESHTTLQCSSHFPGFFLQLFEPTECGNGFVEVGEECDCGARAVSCFCLFFSSGSLFVVDEAPPLFVFRSAIRNAARSVLSLMVHTAAMARAAIPHVWYELGFFTAQNMNLYS